MRDLLSERLEAVRQAREGLAALLGHGRGSSTSEQLGSRPEIPTEGASPVLDEARIQRRNHRGAATSVARWVGLGDGHRDKHQNDAPVCAPLSIGTNPYGEAGKAVKKC
jgi:hypothetical protein